MPDVSIGAVGAAAIAAVVSLWGLIISKEQKTSEFRQAWIDGLREEITTYLTNLNSIADGIKAAYPNHAEKIKALSPHYAALNEATFSIMLRLNATEERSKLLISCMEEFQTLAGIESDMTPENIRPIETRLLQAARDLLKFEWRRVKRGELTFIIAKVVSLALAVVAITFGVLLVWQNLQTAPDPRQRVDASTGKPAVPKKHLDAADPAP